MKKITKVKTSLLVVALGGFFLLSASMLKNNAGPNPPSVVISPVIPSDVSIDPGFPSNALPIAFFDDYSWRLFIAMVWPAKNGQRGVADAALPLDEPGAPRVFETFKSDWEVFKPDGSAPSAWNDFNSTVPCATDPIGFNDMVLASFSKFGNLGQAGFGDLVGPIVAQNNTYVRYLTGFNETEFKDITNKKLYLRSNLTAVTLPNGSIDVKSAWIDMAGITHPERYYTRMAWVLDPSDNSCSKKLVGLVGLHIVQKTPSRPQWIWTSFEHVDNVPQNVATAPFVFNDGSPTAMPTSNPISFPPPPVPPLHFNINRITPINPSTINTNDQYRQALKSKGSVWQFYQLVTTQWPVPANVPANPGDPSHTFPGTGATTAFANVTMETFDQKRITTGCMNCHNSTKAETDFLWSLEVNAFPTPTPSLAMRLAGLRSHLSEVQVRALRAPHNAARVNNNRVSNTHLTKAQAAKLNKSMAKLKALLKSAVAN